MGEKPVINSQAPRLDMSAVGRPLSSISNENRPFLHLASLLKENLGAPLHAIESLQKEQLSFSAFQAIMQSGGRILSMFPPKEDALAPDYFRDHTADIITDCQQFQEISVKDADIRLSARVIEEFTLSYDVPSESVDTFIWTLWRSSLGYSGNSFEDFFARKHKYITRMLVNQTLKKALFTEIPYEQLGGASQPIDTIAALGIEDDGFNPSEESEDYVERIRIKIEQLPRDEYKTIVYAQLRNDNNTLMLFEHSIREDAINAFWHIYYGKAYTSDNPSNQNGKKTAQDESENIKRGTVHRLREQILQRVGGLERLFNLVSSIGIDSPQQVSETMALLYFCGYFHSNERAEVFALNERMSEHVLRRTLQFTNALEHLRNLSLNAQQVPLLQVIDNLERISSEKRYGGKRFILPKNRNDRLITLYQIFEDDPEKAVEASITPRDRVILSIMNDSTLIGRRLSIEELYTLVTAELEKVGLLAWSEKKHFYRDITKIAVKILDYKVNPTKEPKLSARRTKSTEKMAHSVKVSDLQKKEVVSASEEQLAIIYSQKRLHETYNQMISENPNELKAIDRWARMYVETILGRASLENLYKDERKKHRNIRLLIQIIGMKIGLSKEIYANVERIDEIIQALKAVYKGKSTDDLDNFAAQLGCSREIIEKIINNEVYLYRKGQLDITRRGQ